MNAGKGSKPAGEKPAPKGDGKPMEKDGSTDVSHMGIGEVVSKHGPAHSIQIHHDHEGKLSTVTSHHGEKGKSHMHHSEHSGEDHVSAAHEHAGEAAGQGEGKDEEANETPGEEMAEDEMSEQPATAGIPGIKS
jgi:hypothetical protein